jgi:hypothetical protein
MIARTSDPLVPSLLKHLFPSAQPEFIEGAARGGHPQ